MSRPLAQLRKPLRALSLAAVVALAAPGPAWCARWDESGIGVPLLHTYTARDTGTLAAYRCALRARNGFLYVGHDGLLEFDGETWRPMPLPDGAAVRTIAEDENGGIVVGGENLLGVLTRSPDTAPQFTSLLPRIPPEHRRDLGSVSAVFALPKGQIVAVTENRVYSLRPAGAQVWSLPAPRRLSAWRDDDGNVFIVQPGTATLRVTDSGLESGDFPEPYASVGVEWAVRAPDGSRLLGAGHRLLRQQDGQITPVAGSAAERLREDRITSAIRLPGGFAALGSLRHGILIVDSTGQQVAALDHTGDLPDNRVLHLSASPDYGICATTPEALVVFCDELRATAFDSRHGLTAKRISAFARTNVGLFLANDKRILRLNGDRPENQAGFWQPWSEMSDTVSSLLTVDDQLLGATGSALGLHGPTEGAPLILRTGDLGIQCPWRGAPGGLSWIEGTHFFRGNIVGGKLQLANPPIEIDTDACSLLEDVDGAHWIGTTHSGVTRIAPSELIQAGKPTLRNYRSNLRSSGSITPRLFRVGSHVMITTETGLALHTEAGDRFQPYPAITGARVHAISETEPDGTVWLALSQRERFPFQIRIARLRPTDTGVACELVRLPALALEEPPSALFAEPGNSADERVFWLGLSGRVLRIESPGTLADNPPPSPRISALTIFDDVRGTHPLSRQQARVDFDNAGVRFDVSVPDGRLGQRVHLEARLVDFDPDWVPLGEIPSRVFRGLRDRAYRFEARSIDALGRPSATAVLEFSVQPPWWRSAPAYIAYALGLVVFSGLVFLTRLRLARTHRRELEALVAERTRQLAEANAAKSEFLAHVNHEIRNPLNGVIGLSAMLANQHQDEASRQLARSLKACAGYLGSVVDNVLDLARIESGRIEISAQRFDPRLLVEDIAEMFRLQVEEVGGRISWSVDPDLPSALFGDVHRIRQVLVNFTANAARYARGGDVRISARRRSQAQNRITVVFTVADTGPGIAPSEQNRIFEKFARGQSAGDADTPRGYGVGLALVRDLAELLGGEADVDSQLGLGAKFRLTIPLEIAATEPPKTKITSGSAAAPAALRVLVIDDQAFNRLVLRDHLERLGCKVEESADGPSAHLLLQARAHHMAFVDLDLPGLDGLALIRHVRHEGADRPVFLVATTASATRGIEELVLAAGADAFLPKPISLPHLAGLLEACAARLERRPTTPARPAEPSAPAISADAVANAGLFANLPLTADLLRSLHSELDVETQALTASWRQADAPAARRHAHRIASLGILARDEKLLQAARQAEESIQHSPAEASRSVDALQLAARARIQLLGSTVAITGKDGHN